MNAGKRSIGASGFRGENITLELVMRVIVQALLMPEGVDALESQRS
jgi:hypothetical protein